MFIEFLTRAKRIFADRQAFYYFPGEKLDLPDGWALEHIAHGEARQCAPPDNGMVLAKLVPPLLGDDDLTVVCVLKSGGIYDHSDYVGPLYRAVQRNLTQRHRFVCMTDMPGKVSHLEGVEVMPLQNNWPGFWSKIEVYRPGQFTGPVLMLDLDMVICGSLDDLVGIPDPLVCSWDLQHGWINSSILLTRVDLSAVYDAMMADPLGAFAKYNNGEKYGDQGLLQDTLISQRIGWTWFQEYFPEQIWIHSNALRSSAPPEAVRVSNWCGHPKPHQVQNNEWLNRHWR